MKDFIELAFIVPGVGTSSGTADVAAVRRLRIVAVTALKRSFLTLCTSNPLVADLRRPRDIG